MTMIMSMINAFTQFNLTLTATRNTKPTTESMEIRDILKKYFVSQG